MWWQLLWTAFGLIGLVLLRSIATSAAALLLLMRVLTGLVNEDVKATVEQDTFEQAARLN